MLLGIADILHRELRDYDVAGRFGGEEFAVLLPETDTAEALIVAERIRAALAASEFDAPTAGAPIRATVSCGVASFPHHADTAEGLLHQADLAVFEGKASGRNRVVLAREAGIAPQTPAARVAS